MKLKITLTVDVPEQLRKLWEKHGITAQELSDRFHIGNGPAEEADGSDTGQLGFCTPGYTEDLADAIAFEHASLQEDMWAEASDSKELEVEFLND